MEKGTPNLPHPVIRRGRDEDLGKGRPPEPDDRASTGRQAPDEVFGPSAVTTEVNKRWGAKLRRKADPRTVAATLRRWAVAGRIHRAREGRAHYELLYV